MASRLHEPLRLALRALLVIGNVCERFSVSSKLGRVCKSPSTSIIVSSARTQLLALLHFVSQLKAAIDERSPASEILVLRGPTNGIVHNPFACITLPMLTHVFAGEQRAAAAEASGPRLPVVLLRSFAAFCHNFGELASRATTMHRMRSSRPSVRPFAACGPMKRRK